MSDEKSPADRLRDYIREHSPGCCKILSLGDECLCPLCDLDRLVNKKCVHQLAKEFMESASNDY